MAKVCPFMLAGRQALARDTDRQNIGDECNCLEDECQLWLAYAQREGGTCALTGAASSLGAISAQMQE